MENEKKYSPLTEKEKLDLLVEKLHKQVDKDSNSEAFVYAINNTVKIVFGLALDDPEFVKYYGKINIKAIQKEVEDNGFKFEL